MVAVSAVALVIGLLGLLGWVAAGTVGESVAGWSRLDPEARFGAAGRAVIAGLVGFGMGGLSSSFAGWPGWATVGAALAGAAVAIGAARLLAPAARGRRD
ncbi:MAG: hypothetical protein PVI35_03125 [Acidimicrobiia bacterium]